MSISPEMLIVLGILIIMFIVLIVFGFLFYFKIKKIEETDSTDKTLGQLLELKEHLSQDFNNFTNNINEQVSSVKKENENKLSTIKEKIEDTLRNHSEKNFESMGNIQERLAVFDNTQKRLEDFSSTILEFKNILNDKKSRGAFGEFQLENIVEDALPVSFYDFQKTLSNNLRADCFIKFPENNGLVIDSKFPLENFKTMLDHPKNDPVFLEAEKKFKQDVKKHIDDISKKYIIEGETADFALLFLPSELIFSEIHSSYLDIIVHAKSKKVWFVSPNTLMAFVVTMASIIKNENAKDQIHLIHKHLIDLSKDFLRFNKRMENFSKHFEQLNEDIEQIKISSSKIISRFNKIEEIKLEEEE